MDHMEKLKELMELCIAVTQTTEHDVWFNFSGHVNEIEVRISPGGHKGWIDENGKYRSNSDDMLRQYLERDSVATELQNAIDILKTYL